VKKVVVKIGTALLTDRNNNISRKIINKIAKEIAEQRKKGFVFIVVSSGAIGCGRIKTNSPRPKNLAQAQVLSSIGQPILMNLWMKAFEKHEIVVSQILATRNDFSDRESFLNLKRTILNLLEKEFIPIINENDSVAVEEIKFGDNDYLAAIVASHIEADELIILTNVDGVIIDGKLLPEIKKIDEKLLSKLGGVSTFGTGGMKSKLEAGKITQMSGVNLTIANGTTKNILRKILIEKKKIGTKILPIKKIKHRKMWIGFSKVCNARISVDRGAYLAIKEKGKSLLPAGILEICGEFEEGDAVSISFEGKDFAKGITNYNSKDVEKIKGKKSYEVEKILKIKSSPEVIHRDNLVLLEE